jgi:Tetratricopeptide repeat
VRSSARAAATPATAPIWTGWPASPPASCCRVPAATPIRTARPRRILLSLDDLATADPGGHARRLLDCLAVLAPAGADPTLLHHLTTHAEPAGGRRWWRLLRRPGIRIVAADVDAVVAVLAGRSLTMPTVEGDRVVVHRLVQRVLRDRAQRTRRLDAVLATTADRLEAAAAAQIGSQWDTRTLIAEYAEHALSLWTHAASEPTQRRLLTLRRWVVYWLNEVHNFTAAITLGVALVGDCERVLGPEHPDTLRSRNNLADTYRAMGRLDEAIRLNEQTLTDSQRVLGPDHPTTRMIGANLTAVLAEREEARRVPRHAQQQGSAATPAEPDPTGSAPPELPGGG